MLSATAGIPDVIFSKDVAGCCLLLADYLCCIGNNDRALTGIRRHVEIEQLDIVCAILSIITPFHSTGDVIAQLHLASVSDFNHHISLQHLQICHAVLNIDTSHIRFCIANLQGIIDDGIRIPFSIVPFSTAFRFDNGINRLFFVCNSCFLCVSRVLTVLLRSVRYFSCIIDTICLRRIRINQFHSICSCYRAISSCSFRECIVK